MSGTDGIKRALRESGLRIPANANDEMLGEAADPVVPGDDPWWCPIACKTGCFWGACAVGHCVFQCSSGECSSTNCLEGDIFGGGGDPIPIPDPEPQPR